jgi:hypothetical protein
LNGLKPIDIAPSYTTSPLGKIGTLRRPWPIKVGSLKSTWRHSSPYNISANISLFGSNSRKSLFKMALMMQSLGTSPTMATIHLHPPTVLNSLELHLPPSPPRCGSFGPRLNTSSSCGSRFKIGFGLMTVWRRGGGQILGSVPYANEFWNPLITFLSIVVTPFDFGVF